jgi:hypothetical protein
MENRGKPTKTKAPIAQPGDNWWIRLISYMKRKMDEGAAKKKNETAVDRAARVTAKATVWIAFFTFVSIAISTVTLLILKGQLTEMHEGGVDIHTTSYRELRPYVHVTKYEFTGNPIKGEMAHGKASIINSGRTPAVNLHGCSDITIKPNGDPMTDDFPCPAPNNPKRQTAEEVSKFVLGSGISDFSVDSPGTTIKPTNLSTEAFTQLLATGAFRIYFYGDIEYNDIVDPRIIHHTTFCGRYNVQTGRLDICEKHNRMD